jgi:hypothetical protein
VGKDADLVLYNQYPLSVYAVPESVYIDGELYFSRVKDLERQAAIEAEKKELMEKEKPAKNEGRKKKGGAR